MGGPLECVDDLLIIAMSRMTLLIAQHGTGRWRDFALAAISRWAVGRLQRAARLAALLTFLVAPSEDLRTVAVVNAVIREQPARCLISGPADNQVCGAS
jgi:hypothetical protein